MTRCLLIVPIGLLALVGPVSAAEKDVKGLDFFENKIRPVLATHCFECHSAKASKVKGGLLLDSRDGIRNGGDTGPAVVPGDPAKSLLIKSLKHDGLKMPPKQEPLSDKVVADFVAWVKMGAPDPRDGTASAYKRMTAEEAKTFWSFQPPKKTTPPSVKGTWAKTDIDRFILAQLEQKNLKPVGDADRLTLLRRVYFDLVGLPPTLEQIDKALADKSEKWFETVVDELLKSPHFGERWGRHWLDLARYGESNGNSDNTPFPHAWRYRDYVIKSFNDDKPYSRFIQEQIAGDLLKEDDAKKKDDLLIATGFLALTSKPRAQNNPDYRMDLIADQVDVTTRAVLGMTVLCSRCHDHKFDQITTKEYYALAGFFESSQMLFGGGGGKGGGKGAGPGGLHKLSDDSEAMGVRDGKPTDTQVCIKGETNKKGERVPRGFLNVATASKAPSIPKGTSGRLELAQWLTKSDNPLTARVAVNRIWMHLFGRGIVDSPDNFGYLGEKPTHPELLDNLAVAFQEDGESTKKLIRRIVLSRAYQLSGEHNEADWKIDPDNRSLWRMSPRRLEGEAIRDAILASSGRLNRDMPKGTTSESTTNAKGKRPAYTVKESAHRSVYLGLPRGAALPEILALFDQANPNLVVAQRETTTVPAQALYLMNSPFVLEHAKLLAKRAKDMPNLDDAGRIDLAYKLALTRLPSTSERERALKFIKESGGKDASWAAFCQALYASAEFRYVD